MIVYKLFRFSINEGQLIIEDAVNAWIKEQGDITITHIAQDKIADIINISVFYETSGPVDVETTSEAKYPPVVYHHPLTEVQTSEQFYALEKAENELKTELTKAGVQARIDEINEGGTLLECYVQFKTLLQKVATSMDDTAKSAIAVRDGSQ